jgi:polyhydroxyalkanoate synthesis regulator phasin
MSEKIKKTYEAGLGLIVLTYEKTENLVKELVKKGEIAKEKQQELIETIIRKAKDNTSQIESAVKTKIIELSEKGEPLKKKQDALIKDISEKAREIGSVTEKNIKKIIQEILSKSKDTKTKIVSSMSYDDKIEAALAKLDVPTKQDVDDIRKKLDELIELQKKQES